MTTEEYLQILKLLSAFKDAIQESLEVLSRKSGEVHGMVERITYGKRGKYRASIYGRVWK